MDIQLKRGLLDACVLKALTKGDSYGYRIIKDLSDHIVVSESTLYPILKRLESAGCLAVYSREHNGRLRKYYSITDTGRTRLNDFLTEWKEVMQAYMFISSSEETDNKGDKHDET